MSDNKSRHALIASCLASVVEHAPIVAMIDSPLAEKPRLMTGAGAGARFDFAIDALGASIRCSGVLLAGSLASPLALSKAWKGQSPSLILKPSFVKTESHYHRFTPKDRPGFPL